MPERQTSRPPSPSPLDEFGPFRLDLSRMAVEHDGVRVPLTPKVYEILVLLVTNHDRVLTREELMHAVWPDTFIDETGRWPSPRRRGGRTEPPTRG